MAIAQVEQGRLMGWYLGKPVYENDPQLSKFLEKPAFVSARDLLQVRRYFQQLCSWCGIPLHVWERSCPGCGGRKS